MINRHYSYMPALSTVVIAFSMVASAHAQSAAGCAARADRDERDSTSTKRGVVGGAGGGAIVGALVGNSKGARRGAVIGGVAGGARGKSKSNGVYKRVYDDCIAGR
jgi:uncharacterized protein YcfJ